ncbi:alpha/beta hydrolase [Mycoplasmopsis phocirhinis]|uniref:Alpha/beta hydrolase n=1 Tax=Mycoplasmopsis phocirhinis TaxID=142650 RepID=A0A4P6MLI0_9BACT|nr:alpha/beta hydrolase [Mycoplasmopsis phocirhinis]QBF34328.1 alpha/beta hydrolase [Mycoplasmopsis phocirhinis]
MIRKLIQIGSETISYLSDENLGKVVVLFLHGFGDEATRAKTLFKNENRIYSIIAPDMPGCGNSTHNKPITMEYYSLIVKQFIEKLLQNKHLYIVTHSLGSIAALSNATTNPNIIQIFSVAPLMPRDQDDATKKQTLKWLLPNNPQELYDSQFNLFCDEDNSYILQESVKNKILNTDESFFKHRHSVFKTLTNEILQGTYVKNVYENYFKTKRDFMAFISQKDKYFDYKASKKYVDLYNISTAEINDSGHAMLYKNTQKIHKYINNFIFKKEGFY